MRKPIVTGLLASVFIGLAATAVFWLAGCGSEPQTACCAAPSTTSAPRTTAPEDGSGLRRNNSPSPSPTPTTEAPHFTLHIPWPKRDPGTAGG